WCTPCLKEIPMFNRVQKEYAPDGVQFIGIAIDNKASIEKFMQKTPINYPVLYGVKTTTELVQDYGNDAGVLPYTVFIDHEGIIQRIAPGQLKETYTRESIEKML
ncbi:MAG: TlpA family protein disulfide reductase, partial [Gammaproteobacteria bacterium]|nr:TlpA family protein disulfide reductase [Gammaproteobacteria bacterium]